MIQQNVVIIGSGPAGSAAALYCARFGLSPIVCGGSPSNSQLLFANNVENYPGFFSIKGSELINTMKNHAIKNGALFYDENVIKISKKDLFFDVYTEKKVFNTKTIIVATGACAKWLGLESEQRLIGKGVSACATCDGFFFRNKVVAVVGGGDTALEDALILSVYAKKVIILHRRDSFRASEALQKKVFKNKIIEIVWNTEVKEILGETCVVGLTTKDGKTFNLDGVFIAIGQRPNTDFLSDSGVLRDKEGYIISGSRIAFEIAKSRVSNEKFYSIDGDLDELARQFIFEYQSITSVPGIFAAGDCTDKIYRQASTAVGAGVIAACDVRRYLQTIKKI